MSYQRIDDYESQQPTVIGVDSLGHAAVQVYPDGQRIGQDPGRFRTRDEATALLNRVRKDTGVPLYGPFPKNDFDLSQDPLKRGEWMYAGNGQQREMRSLFVEEATVIERPGGNLGGVGAPGKWAIVDGIPRFSPTPPVVVAPVIDTNPKPGQTGGMMGPGNLVPGGESGQGFTDADRARSVETLAVLQRVAKGLGI